MSYQRITISLPNHVYEDLLAILGKGKISSFVADAAEAKLLEEKLEPKDPIEAFFALRKITTKKTTKQILAGIREGRT